MTETTVVELTRFGVEPPLFDGAQVWEDRLGLFSTHAAARAWLEASIGNGGAADFAVVYFTAREIVLDITPVGGPQIIRETVVYDGDCHVRGFASGDDEEPWAGRPTVECRYGPGDFVGLFYGETYRMGIVLAQPPPPQLAAAMQLTRGDDVYLVGLLGADGTVEADDHDHVWEPLLFAAGDAVPAETKRRLLERATRYGGFSAR